MVKKLINFLKIQYYRIFKKKLLYVNKYVEQIPDNMRPGLLYVERNGNEYWFASLLCPCGCKQELNINLDENESPCWKLSEGEFTDISPSLWKNKGCKSHFFLRKGEVKWC
jgi:hypothetical protein